MVRTTALVTLFACAIALSEASPDKTTSVSDRIQDIDRSIRPGDDFYRYANGHWLQVAIIPQGQASYDTRAILVARTSQRVSDLIQAAALTKSVKGSVAQKVGGYYASFM